MNLDSLWGWESLTVEVTLQAAKQMISQWSLVGIPLRLPPLVPFLVENRFGLRVAVAMLLKSLQPG
jgi:hypothetical protein